MIEPFALVARHSYPFLSCFVIWTMCKEEDWRESTELAISVSRQECPTGTVNEATFKRIYTHFFPYGGNVHIYTRSVYTVQ